ncbi:hypothetical protein, partial [Rubrivirga sp.]|uniref:hypothetical protein n=1 Tax=Rubrivirga sp. TaxID=1885344 RepID=UPI003C734A0B
MTPSQRRLVMALAEDAFDDGRWPPATLAFYTHVLQSLCAPGPQSDRQSVPVPWDYARDAWGVRHMGEMVRPLVEAGLLEVTPR